MITARIAPPNKKPLPTQDSGSRHHLAILPTLALPGSGSWGRGHCGPSSQPGSPGSPGCFYSVSVL